MRIIFEEAGRKYLIDVPPGSTFYNATGGTIVWDESKQGPVPDNLRLEAEADMAARASLKATKLRAARDARNAKRAAIKSGIAIANTLPLLKAIVSDLVSLTDLEEEK